MKTLSFILTFCSFFLFGQQIAGIQLFNPETNDETAIIEMGQQLILSFDDLQNRKEVYRYTIKHLNRDWEDDGLFFTEYAEGSMNALIDDYQSSFNTRQFYTHYQLTFPNAKIRPKISGNYEIIVYKDRAEKPLFTRRFVVVERADNTAIQVERYANAQKPDLRQRVKVSVSADPKITQNIQSISLSVMQNNNWNQMLSGLKPSQTLGSGIAFQQMDLAFPGNNQFYYFDSNNLMSASDMVARISTEGDENEILLFPVLAYPMDYQYQPDVHGAFYFRRNDNGIERDAFTEGDYAWVNFALDSHPLEDKEIYILGKFNEYQPQPEYKMEYHADIQKYIARIYLKQGFYNYILATVDSTGKVNMGEINGNFWQTTNLYQAITYYTSWQKNYDGALSYGELRPMP